MRPLPSLHKAEFEMFCNCCLPSLCSVVHLLFVLSLFVSLCHVIQELFWFRKKQGDVETCHVTFLRFFSVSFSCGPEVGFSNLRCGLDVVLFILMALLGNVDQHVGWEVWGNVGWSIEVKSKGNAKALSVNSNGTSVNS